MALIGAAALLTQPARAQNVTDSDRAEFAAARSCIAESIPQLDDRISSAEIIARSALSACQDKLKLTQHTTLERVVLSRVLNQSLQDEALEGVLKLRSKSTKSQGNTYLSEMDLSKLYKIAAPISRKELGRFSLVNENYYEATLNGIYYGLRTAIDGKELKIVSRKVISSSISEENCNNLIKDLIYSHSTAGYVVEKLSFEAMEIDYGINNSIGLGFRLGNGDHVVILVCKTNNWTTFNLEIRDGLQSWEMEAYRKSIKEAIGNADTE
ncbi:MAG: hypothetical protein P0Y66_02040 [Candidatus Kaistia colombiensis]|nr:MAG: hypothetical protein P0Y66_02040 [Kaistia sp.]